MRKKSKFLLGSLLTAGTLCVLAVNTAFAEEVSWSVATDSQAVKVVSEEKETEKETGREAAEASIELIDPESGIIQFKIGRNLDNTYSLIYEGRKKNAEAEVKVRRKNGTGEAVISLECPDGSSVEVLDSPQSVQGDGVAVFRVRLTDTELDAKIAAGQLKIPFDSKNDLNIRVEANGQIESERTVRAGIDLAGFYDEHFLYGPQHFTGIPWVNSQDGSEYKKVGVINLADQSSSVITISVNPYILEADDWIEKLLLNPAGNFEFLDGGSEYILDAPAETVTFQIRLKPEVFNTMYTETVTGVENYRGMYLLSDLAVGFVDGCEIGGKVSALPLVYQVVYNSNSSDGSGGSGGGGGGGSSSGGGGGGSSSGGGGGGSSSVSGGSGGPMADNQYNTAANDDIGWRQDADGSWRYLNKENKETTGWLLGLDGNWYFLEADGKMATGWKQVAGKWYLLQATGAMSKGWATVGEKKYYLNTDGSMATGWIKESDGSWYYLQSDGSMAYNTMTPDGYYVDENGIYRP